MCPRRYPSLCRTVPTPSRTGQTTPRQTSLAETRPRTCCHRARPGRSARCGTSWPSAPPTTPQGRTAPVGGAPTNPPGLAALPCPESPLGLRNRAMLLLGFGAALRRSELVSLCIGDVRLVPGRGLTVLVRRSKTDQHGRGQQVEIWANPADPLTCPAAS